jgi:ribose transport system permease protein
MTSNMIKSVSRRNRHVWRAIRPFAPVLAMLFLLGLIGGLTQPVFLTLSNVQNLLVSQSMVWVVALAMTFVIISAGLDLSVGAISTFAGVVLVKLIGAHVPGWLSVLLAVIAGTAFGAIVNGLLVGRARLSVFVVTLASLTALTGFIQLWTGSSSAFISEPFVIYLGNGTILGIAVPICVMTATLVLAFYVERYTYFGRDVFAIGGSVAAAELSGIRTSRTLIAVYAIAGGAAAIAGVVGSGITGAATAQVDNTLALQAIAAVLLGGTLLTGGAGSVIGTVLGVLFIGGLGNYLSISGVPGAWQQVLTGVILVVAVGGGRLRRTRFIKRGDRDPKAPAKS